MTSSTARTQRRHGRSLRRASAPLTLMERVRRITLPGWVTLAACAITLVFALQSLQGRAIDYDEGVYWQSLRAMTNDSALYGSIFNSQPPLFLLSIYPFYVAFGQSLSAARVGLLAFALLGLAGVYVLGRALDRPGVGATAALLLALDPLYEHAAHTLEAELPSLALQVWAVACAALAMRTSGRRRDWLALAAGAFLGGALMMKLFAVAAVVPVVLLLIDRPSPPTPSPTMEGTLPRRVSVGTGSPSPHRRGVRGEVLEWPTTWPALQNRLREVAPTLGWAAAGLVGVVVLVLLPFLGQLGTVYDQVVAFHLAAQSDGQSLGGNLRIIGQTLWATPLLYLGIPAAALLLWRRTEASWVGMVMIAWVLAALLVVVRQEPLFPHHVVLLSPALALSAAFGALTLWRWLAAQDREQLGQGIALVMVTLACGAGLALNIVRNADASRPTDTRSVLMALTLQGVSAPTEVVLSDDQTIAALANRDVPPQLVDTSQVRISSGYLTTAQLEAFITRNRIHAILFAAGRFDLLPGFRAWVAAHYSEVNTFPQNGALYLLAPNDNPPV